MTASWEVWARLIILMFGLALLVAYYRRPVTDNLIEAILFILLGSILFFVEAAGVMTGDTNWLHFVLIHVPIILGITGIWYLAQLRWKVSNFYYGVLFLSVAMLLLIYAFVDATIPTTVLFTDPYFVYVLGTTFIGFVAVLWFVWTDIMKRVASYRLLIFTTIYVVIGIVLILVAFGTQYA